MKHIFLLLILLAGLELMASESYDCQSRLLAGELDSNSFFVSEDNFDKGLLEDESQFALAAVKAIHAQVGCENVALASEQVSCREIKELDQSSKVCLLESSAGMYFIVPDFMGNARVVFNRWD